MNDKESLRDERAHVTFMQDVLKVKKKTPKPRKGMTTEEAIAYLRSKGLLQKKEEEKKE